MAEGSCWAIAADRNIVGMIKQTTKRVTIRSAAGVDWLPKPLLQRKNKGQLTTVTIAAIMIAVKKGLTTKKHPRAIADPKRMRIRMSMRSLKLSIGSVDKSGVKH